MEPNEPTQSHTGQTVSISGDYSAACCSAVKQLSAGQVFPNCSEHGETDWTSIPPFVQTDWGTAALFAHWKHWQAQRAHAAVLAQNVVLGRTVHGISPSGIPSEEAFGTPKLQPYPEILLQHAITVVGGKTSEGLIIEAVTPAWFEILEQLERDPMFIYKFAKYPRKFEEMMAGAYERYGWKVTLTPPSRDKGRDIIAVRRDSVEIRLVDQVKAYSPHRVVPAKDVDALLGVLKREPNVATGVITTTSRFAPGIEKEASFKNLMPRLTLRDGKQLQDWLRVLKPS